MLFSQTISLILLLASPALAEEYKKIPPGFIKTISSIDVGVDCETHVYSGEQLKKLAYDSLRFGRLVNYCVQNICRRKIDYESKYMGYVHNLYYTPDAYYIRARQIGGNMKGRFARNNIVVVTKEGLILGVLTKRYSAWLNCPNRPKFGIFLTEQKSEILAAERKAAEMKNAKAFMDASSPSLEKFYPTDEGDKRQAQRDATSPRGSSSPPAADASTSGTKV